MLHYLCRFFLLPFKSIDVPLNFSMTHNGKFLNFLLNFLVSLHHIIIFYSLLLAPPCSSSRASSESLMTNVVYTVETGLTCGAFLLASLRAASAAVWVARALPPPTAAVYTTNALACLTQQPWCHAQEFQETWQTKAARMRCTTEWRNQFWGLMDVVEYEQHF